MTPAPADYKEQESFFGSDIDDCRFAREGNKRTPNYLNHLEGQRKASQLHQGLPQLLQELSQKAKYSGRLCQGRDHRQAMSR